MTECPMCGHPVREAVLKATVNSFEHLRDAAAELPIERGMVSDVEYVPLRGNAPDDLYSLIDAAIEGARVVGSDEGTQHYEPINPHPDDEAVRVALSEPLEYWRAEREKGNPLAQYYVDAFASALHNVEHALRSHPDEGTASGSEAVRLLETALQRLVEAAAAIESLEHRPPSDVWAAEQELNEAWRNGKQTLEALATPPPVPTVEQDEAVRLAVESMEQLLWGYDWLGTGTSQRLANKEEREAWDQWTTIRHALGLGDPENRP